MFYIDHLARMSARSTLGGQRVRKAKSVREWKIHVLPYKLTTLLWSAKKILFYFFSWTTCIGTTNYKETILICATATTTTAPRIPLKSKLLSYANLLISQISNGTTLPAVNHRVRWYVITIFLGIAIPALLSATQWQNYHGLLSWGVTTPLSFSVCIFASQFVHSFH